MILDLFAGPGGWDLAAVALGLDPLGVEFDDSARATRDAAGLTTHPVKDVRDVDLGALGPVAGLIASPPCQTFSMAGKGAGRVQSFPPDYPWTGTKTKQYQQVGNAIPPLLAAHILAEAVGIRIADLRAAA